MESLEKELGVLLAEQMREQMNNLSAAVQLLTDELGDRDEKCRQYLAIMNQSMYRMMRMVSNLEYVNAMGGAREFQGREVDLAGLCRDLEYQVQPLLRRGKVSFTYREERSDLIVQGDSALLRRMLLNLIANAIQAAGRRGETGLHLSANRERAVITVWDNGPGLEKMQGYSRALERPDGLGLGLKVVRDIVQLHGGTLVFDQREGRGLNAVVSLPLCQPNGQQVKTPPSQVDGSGGFAPILVELAGVLPFQVYLPGEREE